MVGRESLGTVLTPGPEHKRYRGRLAPSPTGYLHLGHAVTFWKAQERARQAGGVLVLRNEDLDRSRSKQQFVAAMLEDLRWFGLHWQEGPDCGGSFGPYSQSERLPFYQQAFEMLQAKGFVYPCTCSRKDVLRSLSAPHAGEEEPIYPGTCRDKSLPGVQPCNWRFRVPDGTSIAFRDGHYGHQCFTAGKDLGDFIVWRADGWPSYQLAVTVDDAAMHITEVVRGADLLLSTARQLLLYDALGAPPPAFYHCPLLVDSEGKRLAKRHDSLSLRQLRMKNFNPAELINNPNATLARYCI